MATLIITSVQARNGVGSTHTYVKEEFDTVMDVVVPLNQPSSALEARSAMTFHDPEDNRIYIAPKDIAQVHENQEEE